jgi:hypothetical protein
LWDVLVDGGDKWRSFWREVKREEEKREKRRSDSLIHKPNSAAIDTLRPAATIEELLHPSNSSSRA